MRRWLLIGCVAALLCVAAYVVLARIVPEGEPPGHPSAVSRIDTRGSLAAARGVGTDVLPAPIAIEAFFLRQGEVEEFEVSVGTCDSVEFNAMGTITGLALSIEDPKGRRLSADVAGVSFQEKDALAVWRVRSPLPGEWTVTVRGKGSPQQGFLSGVEYGGVDAWLSFANQGFAPGETQTIELALGWRDRPVGNVKAAAIVTDPKSHKSNVPLRDDGTHGDRVADDGVYTAEVRGNDIEGLYMVDAWAKGRTSRGVVNRQLRGQYYEVATWPDLEIPPGGVIVRPTSDEDVFTVEVTFTNEGIGPAECVEVEFNDKQIALPFATEELENIPPGTRVTRSADWRRETYHDGTMEIEVALYACGGELEPRIDNNRGRVTFDLPARH
jgi:hypothetical protein